MANGANYNGQIIGNYRIEKELADGGFGTVYLAKHTVLINRTAAMKLLHAAHLGSQKERDQFIQEAQLLENLKHPRILPLLDVGIHNGVPYLVSEYATQGSLRNLLEQRRKPLSVQEIIAILSQVGEALQFAHSQNVIHRDIKPENILFNAKGEALLADFGIATTLTTRSVQKATVVGTFNYMAPEQFNGEISKESDQYALGCVAYELATGRQAFDTPNIAMIINMHFNHIPTNPSQLNPQLPAHISQAIMKALAKQRGDRFVSIDEFIVALALQTPVHAVPASPRSANPSLATPAPSPVLSPTVPVGSVLAARTPQTKEEWLRLGKIHYNAQQYDEALKACEQAIILEPTDAITHYSRGLVLLCLKRYREALTSYEQALQLDRNLALAYYGKGNTYYELKRYKNAYQAYEDALTLKSQLTQIEISQAYTNQGYITCYSLEDPNIQANRQEVLQKALAKFEQAIKIDASFPEAHYGKGLILSHLNRIAEALAAFQQVVRLAPHNADAYYNMGWTLNKLGLYTEALAALQQVVRLAPHNADAYYSMSQILRKLKLYKEAKEAYAEWRRLTSKPAETGSKKNNWLNRLFGLEDK